ncbi:Peroxisome assembly factor 2 [Chionoecetes opilio]|uniref:Peroxisomal ATPase PEX6 n=1 Tax=Chionoecetes opilio TaxID=41210 RepID=A0A8J4Y1G1_CHIOP|nr:Peroxisome assembly factor 2 [Chionoecetes opilio]
MTEPSDVLACLQVLLYTCVLLKAVKPHLLNPLSYAGHRGRGRPGSCRLKVQRVSAQALLQKAPQGLHCELDLNAVAVISEKTAVDLDLKNGQWQRVIICHHNYSSDKQMCRFSLSSAKGRWIQVLLWPEVEDKLCLVSPTLYHNLHGSGADGHKGISVDFVNCYTAMPSEAVKKVLALWNEVQGVDVSKSSGMVTPCSPNMASEIHVKVTDSAQYKYSGELESLLKDYFRIPKIVSQGDTLVLPIPSHLAHEFTPSNVILPPRNVFVKVIRVIGKAEAEVKHCVHVAVGSTSLYLAGTTHSSLPSYTEEFDNQGDIDVPPLLRKTYIKLRKIMQILLQEGGQKRDVISNNPKKISSAPSTPRSSNREREEVHTSTHEEPDHKAANHIKSVTVLVLSPPGQGSEQVVKLAASAVGIGTVWVNCWQLKGDSSGATEARLHQVFVRAAVLAPCVLVLQDVHCLAKDRDGEGDARVVAALREEAARLCREDPSVVLIATAPDRDAVSDDLWSVWSYQESVGVADLGGRCDMLEWLLSPRLPAHHCRTLAQRTAGYTLGDFVALENAAKRQCLIRVADEAGKEQCHQGSVDHQASVAGLQYCDVLQALDELQASRSEALGAPHIPKVQWGEVGGLEGAKRQIINTIQLPLRYPALVASKLRHSGVLLYGPPGTGKTLLAKAVATECGLNFLSVKGPELLNMYVGQSEDNVRRVFKSAHVAAPCVIFFDELDSLAPNRGRSGDSGGVMDRIVSALLAELDGVADAADVFVLAATNRPDLLDPALLRPGRFEKLVFVGVCEDHEGQVKILKAVTSKIPVSPSVSLERVASLLPLSLTGADLYALVTDALYSALHRCIKDVRAWHPAGGGGRGLGHGGGLAGGSQEPHAIRQPPGDGALPLPQHCPEMMHSQ